MKVSTDGILLGAWTNLTNTNNLLDIGCGTGLLSLMAAQRNPQVQITAVDIESSAIESAQLNVTQSPWAKRITIIKQDIQHLAQNAQTAFDTIICNPPYFTTGLTADNDIRATARHTMTLSPQSLMDAIDQLITPTGAASLIIPTQENASFLQAATNHQLFVRRYTQVQTTPTKPASRLLIELVKVPVAQPILDSLVIQKQGHYTPEFTQLTKDFYLKM